MKDDNWYLNKIHLHYVKRADFDRDLSTRNISKKSIVFIDEGRLIWTHGKFYQCEAGSWEQITGLISSLNFRPTTNEDGSTTYTLWGKDISGNDFATDASFNLLKNIFIESATLSDDGKTLVVIMNNGDEISIDLTKLFQLQDFVDSTSIKFIKFSDPNDPNNTLISAFAKKIYFEEDRRIQVSAERDGVNITTANSSLILNNDGLFVESKKNEESEKVSISLDNNNGLFVANQNFNLGENFEVNAPGNIFIEGQNGQLQIDDDTSLVSTSGKVIIASAGETNVQGSTVNISSTDGDIIIESSEGNSVKITSPLYLSEEYSDVEQTLRDLEACCEGGGSNLNPGNGITIEDNTISIDSDQYFETTQQYWDNN